MDDINSYEPPPSLWSLVQQYLPDSEQHEVRKQLGESLIEQSKELRLEINTLLEIVQDQREEFETTCTSPEASLPSLPEPPELRQRLQQEIIFFIEGLREQANTQGRDPEKVIRSVTSNSNVIDYAYETGSSRPSTSEGSRPSTSRSSIRVTPLSFRSETSSLTSARGRSLDADVGHLKEKLNYLSFNDVKKNLQQLLQEEVDQLIQDHLWVQSCLYEENSSQNESRASSSMSLFQVPTIAELKAERSHLEQELLKGCSPVCGTPAPDKPSPIPNLVERRPSIETKSNGLSRNHSIDSIRRAPSATEAPLKPVRTPVVRHENRGALPAEMTLLERRMEARRLLEQENSAFGKTKKTSDLSTGKKTSQKSASSHSAQRFRNMVTETRHMPSS